MEKASILKMEAAGSWVSLTIHKPKRRHFPESESSSMPLWETQISSQDKIFSFSDSSQLIQDQGMVQSVQWMSCSPDNPSSDFTSPKGADRPQGPPSLLSNGYRALTWRQSGRHAKLVAPIVPSLKMSGAVPPNMCRHGVQRIHRRTGH